VVLEGKKAQVGFWLAYRIYKIGSKNQGEKGEIFLKGVLRKFKTV